MADLHEHIVNKLVGRRELRGVPYPVTYEVVRMTLHEVGKFTYDEQLLSCLLHSEQLCFCDACGKLMESRDVYCHGGSDDSTAELCKGCFEQFEGNAGEEEE